MHEGSTGNVTDVGRKRKNTVQCATEALDLAEQGQWAVQQMTVCVSDVNVWPLGRTGYIFYLPLVHPVR